MPGSRVRVPLQLLHVAHRVSRAPQMSVNDVGVGAELTGSSVITCNAITVNASITTLLCSVAGHGPIISTRFRTNSTSSCAIRRSLTFAQRQRHHRCVHRMVETTNVIALWPFAAPLPGHRCPHHLPHRAHSPTRQLPHSPSPRAIPPRASPTHHYHRHPRTSRSSS